jgi:excinuclease UvrABC ATPase subunit
VLTGLSGSGKSSLAFDTIYAEGQRRYVESLSAYARQFLELMGKPDVDLIKGLSPAVSIEQSGSRRFDPIRSRTRTRCPPGGDECAIPRHLSKLRQKANKSHRL